MDRMIKALLVCGLLLVVGCNGTQGPVAGNGTASSTATGNVAYDDFFTNQRLRLDMVLAGNKTEQHAYLQEMACESLWAGSPDGLIDRFGYGEYYFEAFAPDADGNYTQLVYSKGFSTYFQEWRTTAQASKVDMACNQTIWMPFPKQCLKVVLYERTKESNMFRPFFSCMIDPADKLIRHGLESKSTITTLLENGPLAHKVDLLFAAEGYSASEMDKFHADAKRFMDYLFTFEPYKSRRNDFNVWAVDCASDDNGVSIPHWDRWKKTACGSNFYTFYLDRYLTISNHKKIAEVVSGAPFDALFIIANEEKYGGGGIFNSYAMGTCGHPLSKVVFIHEFGHSFAGLGDEYYDSEVAYEDYYPLHLEPWEPNITTLVNFESKWKDMMPDGDMTVTPNDSAYMNVPVSLFEGAGYMAKGVYRSRYECRMINNTAPDFCPVCQRAIDRMIDFYVK